MNWDDDAVTRIVYHARQKARSESREEWEQTIYRLALWGAVGAWVAIILSVLALGYFWE